MFLGIVEAVGPSPSSALPVLKGLPGAHRRVVQEINGLGPVPPRAPNSVHRYAT
jgi:hypothetical protein